MLNIISKAIFSFFLITGLLGFHQREGKKSTETGKIKWPEINQEMRPWTRWWRFGNAVTEKDLTAALLEKTASLLLKTGRQHRRAS
jgi:hypothetical protein